MSFLESAFPVRVEETADDRSPLLTGVHPQVRADHPRPTGGDETSLAAIGLADLKAFRREQMGGDRLIIAIAGDFDPATVTRQVREAFGGWGKATGALPQATTKAREQGRRVLLVDKPGATQTYFAMANVGSRRGDPAEAAQDLVQTAFGGRFTLGALVTFVVTVADLAILNVGAAFWGLLAGYLVSWLLERPDFGTLGKE